MRVVRRFHGLRVRVGALARGAGLSVAAAGIAFAVVTAVALAVVTTVPAAAHDGSPHPGSVWSAWSFEPFVVLPLLLTAWLYARGLLALAERPGARMARHRGQVRAFAAGMLALALALISPIDGMASQLFWVHMLQHNLLMLVAAPLLVIAYPLPPLLLGLPRGLRRSLGQGWRRQGAIRGAWGLVSRPLTAWLLHAGLFWLWHAPGLYTLSVDNDAIHALQHACFIGSALLFWWVTLHTFGAHPERRGAGILYLFTTAMQSGLLGALLTFAPYVLYPVYAGRTAAWGLSALEDQQLAGTIMWVPVGFVYLGAALWMMKAWLEGMEKRDRVAARRSAPNGHSPEGPSLNGKHILVHHPEGHERN